jgi:hypothetical protein
MIHTIIDVWGYLNIIMVIVLILFGLNPSGFLDVVDWVHRRYVNIHKWIRNLWQKNKVI